MAPEALASLTPEERHRAYGMLRLKVTAHSDGTLEADGMLAGGVSENEITGVQTGYLTTKFDGPVGGLNQRTRS